jgi:hypothetical protein
VCTLVVISHHIVLAGKRHFIAEMKAKAKAAQNEQDGDKVADSEPSFECVDDARLKVRSLSCVTFLCLLACAQALSELLGGAKPKMVKVDMLKELQDRKLAEHFPVKVWPPSDAVTQLATWVRAATKHKGDQAFVFVDLKRFSASFICRSPSPVVFSVRFLPAKCPAHVTCREMELDCGEQPSVHDARQDAKLKDLRLNWGYWNVAWQRYALAAVATGQMSMSSCQLHSAVVLDVAASAPAQNRSAWLGVLYDELARYVRCDVGVACVFVVFAGKNGLIFRASLVTLSCWMRCAGSCRMTPCAMRRHGMILSRRKAWSMHTLARCVISICLSRFRSLLSTGRKQRQGQR